MSELVRMSISIEPELYTRLNSMIKKSGHRNRSEYIRDMIRDRLVDSEWQGNDEVLGTITFLYDHHARQLSQNLTRLQHRSHTHILVSTHLHLDRHICAEVIVAKGRARHVRGIAEQIRAQKGVLHTSLSMSTTGGKLAG